MIIIVDYSLNNIFSVKSSLEFMNIECKVSNKPEEISKATHIILPGVGSFFAAMQNIKEKNIDILIAERLISDTSLYSQIRDISPPLLANNNL